MNLRIVHSFEPLTLVGGGTVNGELLSEALAVAPRLVAADGGADACLALGHVPEAVIGDMDSISEQARNVLPPETIHPIAEQDSTDFDKALRSVTAPLVVGVGFLGARMDHALAALARLVARAEQRIILLGQDDVIFHAPHRIKLPLPEMARVSLFPMTSVEGKSRGLHWPIDGLDMAPDARIGTSNRATGPVELTFEHPGMLIMLSAEHFRPSVAALLDAAPWPARAR